ncbi:SCP-2 sterol transfer family protein [Mycobacterium simiae]|uniref:SCP-2 sterol transfer family protein n=1 Tax=Mycobacterium simiae TaxID=1784 RepID=A0A1X0XWN1_MYCSI|nr:SCP-2 sterol transfer family protein [Mycobacterium simiae]ORJ57311.1 SCP-2 sterol transfer family protein [Mycobacterium simiae]
MAERVSSLLRRSIAHLEDEVPQSYRVLVATLGSLVVQLDVDGEVFALRGGDRLRVSNGTAPGAGVRIATSRLAVLELIDARVGLGEAVEAGMVRVHGSLDDVQRVHDALQAYVHAAVRASSQPALLSQLRAAS